MHDFACDQGTSPRTRGKLINQTTEEPLIRNIPAHAGKTGGSGDTCCGCSEHPRARGENSDWGSIPIIYGGTSPRTRGKHLIGLVHQGFDLNIPAHAGKTPPVKPPLATPVGTSPRTRGKPLPTVSFHTPPGNIPAHAGKTASWTRPVPAMGEHPRARGENSSTLQWFWATMGTSPRTRGKPREFGEFHQVFRNIPAHAGKTEQHNMFAPPNAEHPRARGENI